MAQFVLDLTISTRSLDCGEVLSVHWTPRAVISLNILHVQQVHTPIKHSFINCFLCLCFMFCLLDEASD